jgi:parvulin-like peptidyl-prolyl isomerase
MTRRFPLLKVIGILSLVFILAACSDGDVVATPAHTTTVEIDKPTTVEPTITLTPTPFVPSATPASLAAQVNGEGILLEDYEAELARFRATSGTGLATNSEEKVLEDLIDQVLLAQAANDAGFVVDETMLQNRIDELGLSDQDLKEWMTVYGYSEDSFLRAMSWAIAAAWMRDQIIAEVPYTAEQVHARQILLYNSGGAEAVFAQLEAGTEFGTLTAEYEPLTKGELGWFPRGYLTVPELDDVLFALEPGAYSSIIQTSLGYHIVQVLERDPNHPLTADARRVLQIQALTRWLEAQRNQSEITIVQP